MEGQQRHKMQYLWLLLCMSIIALHVATDMNTSILDGLYKNRQQWALTFSGPQIAKELDSWEDIVPVIITEVVNSEFGFLPSQALRERWRGSSWTVDWFSNVLRQDVTNAHAQCNVLEPRYRYRMVVAAMLKYNLYELSQVQAFVNELTILCG